jgi:hypothetical protein
MFLCFTSLFHTFTVNVFRSFRDIGIKTKEDDDVDTSKSFIKTLCLSKI